MPLCGTIKKLDFSFNLICIGGGYNAIQQGRLIQRFQNEYIILVKITVFGSSFNSITFYGVNQRKHLRN